DLPSGAHHGCIFDPVPLVSCVLPVPDWFIRNRFTLPPESLSGKAISPFVTVVVGVTIVIGKAADVRLTFPARSVAVAVMLCAPRARVNVVIDQLAELSAAALPIWVVPSNSVTVLFAS